MAGLIRTFLTDREILNGLAIHLIWSFRTYTESPGFKKNPRVVYANNILKITNFSECLKDCTPRKYKFVNSFNVKTDFKRYKVLQGTTYVWKMQNIQQEFVLYAFKSDAEQTFLTPFISSPMSLRLRRANKNRYNSHLSSLLSADSLVSCSVLDVHEY